MDSSKIEVGDMFVHESEPDNHCIAKKVDEDGWITDDDGCLNSPHKSKLVRKSDPYAGITLPEPPQGYRLAKWGEEWTTPEALWSDEGKWVAWDVGSKLVKWHADKPALSIFAIPLDQLSPLKSWQFREVPWVAPEPKTLADCVPNAPVVSPDNAGRWHVVYRVGSQVFCQGGGDYFSAASDAKFIRYLDTPPQKPMSIEDVPDGRVIRCESREGLFWSNGKTWFRWLETGAIYINVMPTPLESVTNYIAEFRGPA